MWILAECTAGWLFLCVCVWMYTLGTLCLTCHSHLWFLGYLMPQNSVMPYIPGMTSPWFVVSRIFYVHPCGAWTNWLIFSGIAWNQQWEDWRIQLWEASPWPHQTSFNHSSWFQLGKNGAHIYDIHNLHNTQIGHHWHHIIFHGWAVSGWLAMALPEIHRGC